MNENLVQRAIDDAFVAHVDKLFANLANDFSEGQDVALQHFARGFDTAKKAYEAASQMFARQA